ncbi:MAG: YIP1 family protein [Gemmatimonadota bacterium]
MEESTSAPLPSLPQRVIQVFFSPGELFAALRDKPVWFGALAVCAVIIFLSTVFIPTDVWIEFSRAQMIESGQEVPAGFESGGAIIRIISVVVGPIAFFVMAFIISGVITLVFSILLGDEGRYVQYLAVMAHASIISSLGALLLLPLKLSQADPSLTLSLGTFAFFLEEGYLFRVLKMIDLFGLWAFAVMAVGVTKIDPRRGFGSALTVFMIFAVGMALLFGLFGG